MTTDNTESLNQTKAELQRKLIGKIRSADYGKCYETQWHRDLADQILALISQQDKESRIDEVYKYLERSDSLSESKYATRRIKTLQAEEDK